MMMQRRSGSFLIRRHGGSSQRRVAFHSGVPKRQAETPGNNYPNNGKGGSSNKAMENFLVEIQKDPSLFGKMWEMASKDARHEMMKPLMNSLSTAVGRREFAKADKNGDGVLTVSEFEHWLTDTLKRSSSKARAKVSIDSLSTTTEVSHQQLGKLAVISAIPFVGFGFLDNAIMICSGSQIDAAFSSFGLSAMAAAALGNTLSDVAGIQAGGVIESMAAKMGLPDPRLSLEQLRSPKVKLITVMSSTVGIVIGCLLGMVPLLFMHEDDRNLKRIFNDIDSDKTGTITFESLESAIEEVGLMVDKEDLHEAFLRIATKVDPFHEDGKLINFREFKILVLEFEQHLKQRDAKKGN